MRNNLKYFRHEVGSYSHWKFKVLRSKYGWTGEGKFWALNCMIAESDDCRLDVSNDLKRKEIASEIDMTLSEFDQFVTFLHNECDLIKIDQDKPDDPFVLGTDIVDETLGLVSNRKERNQRYYNRKKKGDTSDVKTPKSDVQSDTEPATKLDKVIEKGIKTLMEFYGFTEQNHYNQMVEIKGALVRLKREKTLDHFREQFGAYCEYKDKSGEMVHGYKSFLNPEDPKKGKWNETNWIKKLSEWDKTETKDQPKSPAHKIL